MAGIVPFAMASASWGAMSEPFRGDMTGLAECAKSPFFSFFLLQNDKVGPIMALLTIGNTFTSEEKDGQWDRYYKG